MLAAKDAVSVLLLLLLLLMVLCRYRTCGKTRNIRCCMSDALTSSVGLSVPAFALHRTGCSGRARRSSDISGHQHYQQQLACDFNELP